MSPPSCLPIRPVTTLVLLINVVIFMIQVFQGSDWTNTMANQPIRTAFWEQPYRFFTHSWQHLSGPHIFFNMLFLVVIGNPIEAGFGSLPMLGITLLFPFVEGLIYTYIYYTAYMISNFDPHWLQIAVVGYSDSLFALLWVYCVGFGLESISFFGLVSIPARVYPFVLLLISGFGSSVSFLAHLSGIVTGLMYHYGVLNYCTIPRLWLVTFERDTPIGRSIRRWVPNWVDTPELPNPRLQLEQFGWTGVRCTKLPSRALFCSCCVPTPAAPLGPATARSTAVRDAARQRAGAQFVPIRTTTHNSTLHSSAIIPLDDITHVQSNGNPQSQSFAANSSSADPKSHFGQNNHHNSDYNDSPLGDHDHDDSDRDDPELGLLGINQKINQSDVLLPPPAHYQIVASLQAQRHAQHHGSYTDRNYGNNPGHS